MSFEKERHWKSKFFI